MLSRNAGSALCAVMRCVVSGRLLLATAAIKAWPVGSTLKWVQRERTSGVQPFTAARVIHSVCLAWMRFAKAGHVVVGIAVSNAWLVRGNNSSSCVWSM